MNFFPRLEHQLIKDQLGKPRTIIKNKFHDDMEATVIKTEKTYKGYKRTYKNNQELFLILTEINKKILYYKFRL